MCMHTLCRLINELEGNIMFAFISERIIRISLSTLTECKEELCGFVVTVKYMYSVYKSQLNILPTRFAQTHNCRYA